MMKRGGGVVVDCYLCFKTYKYKQQNASLPQQRVLHHPPFEVKKKKKKIRPRLPPPSFLPFSFLQRFYRLQRVHHPSIPAREQNLWTKIQDIRSFAHSLTIASVTYITLLHLTIPIPYHASPKAFGRGRGSNR